MQIEIRINGSPVRAEVEARTLLSDFIRETARLTGTHRGCDTAQCGACTVHLDGHAVKSCNVLALQADGREVMTIEGLAAPGGELHPMQQAFRECHGLQCGFCTPGMVMSAVDLLRRQPGADETAIRHGLEGNLCRCTGYENIVKAVQVCAQRSQPQGGLSMHDFAYHKAQSPADAVAAFGQGADARFLAGGQTLLASLKLRLAQPDVLVDLGRIAELRGVQADGAQGLVIGAMTTHAEVEASALVRARVPALATLAGGIGDPMVRHQGTLGGSLANNDPAADWPAALLGLDGVVTTDRRRIAAGDFVVDLFTTALEPGELIQSVTFRQPTRAAYAKFKHPASRFALVGVFVAELAGEIRVAVTGAGACAFRCQPLEAALARAFTPDSAKAAEIDGSGFNNDLQATAAYRAQLVRVMTARAVERILG